MADVDLDAALALVRAEIKTWERAFASTHGRDPALQDIRDNPLLADKYRLYKRLSRAPTLPTSRPAESVPPLSAFNPFSPTKNSARRVHTLSPTPSIALPRPPPTSTTAVSRARKRLRGEPVSPSPTKPKRQRIRSQALPSPDQHSSNSEHEPCGELPPSHLHSSFVDDSPVKAPAGGKSFKLLFDDALPALSLPKKGVGPSVTHPNSSSDPGVSQTASAGPCLPTSLKPHHHTLKATGISSKPHRRIIRTQPNISLQIFPATDDLPATSHKPSLTPAASRISQPRTSLKRALDGGDLARELTEPNIPLQPQYPLIPPSPPPQDAANRDTGKGRAKTTASRKKLKVDVDDSDEGVDSPDDLVVKVATSRRDRGMQSHRHADELDWDPLLHLGARTHDPDAEEQFDANHHASRTFSVDLPDKFRRVLAISPASSQNSREERLVRGILYGDRVGHYDPSRGGDIWGAGEADESPHCDAETEDDWEGEPVPWEAGEL